MTTTTLTALNTGPGVAFCTVAVIEGWPYALTNSDDPDAVYAALQASSIAGHADILDVVNGLSVQWEQAQVADPWAPFTEPPVLRAKVYPGVSANGVDGDVFGTQVAKRTATHETFLGANLVPSETATLTVASTSAFDASGYLYLGPERIYYDYIDDTQNFATLTRGTCAPFTRESGGRFARRHEIHNLTTETGPVAGVKLQPRVASEPQSWIGRWVGVWLLLKTSTGYVATDQGHLAFAGTIAEIGEGERGDTHFTLEEVRRTVAQTQIMRDPFKARLREGVYIKAGDRFTIQTARNSSTADSGLDGNDLVGTVGASGSNQIEVGNYTADELAAILNTWLQAEKVASRILFNVTFTALKTTADGIRSSLSFDDPTATASIMRAVKLKMPGNVMWFMGWGGPPPEAITLARAARNANTDSPLPPMRFGLFATSPNLDTLKLADPSGTFESQGSLLPAPLRGTSNEIDGLLRIGDSIYARVVYVSDTEFTFTSDGLEAYFPGAGRLDRLYVTVEESDVSLDVRQVVFLEGSFRSIVPTILFSTGTADYNAAGYDSLGAGLGCAIPYSLAGDDFIADITAVACSDLTLQVVLETPTRFSDLFQVDFLLRWCFLTFGGGRLRVGAWSTPTTTYSAVAFTEANKAAPVDTIDAMRSTSVEMVEDIRNVVKVRYGRGDTGDLTRDITIEDAGSYRDHGSRGITLDARNAAPADIGELMATFSGGLSLFSRPSRRIRRPVNFTLFDGALPGAQATISDYHIRNPQTGLRYSHVTGSGGLTGWPCIVVRNWHTWGGTEPGPTAPIMDAHQGEVTVMLYQRATSAPYCPCAKFRGSNYDAGAAAGPTASCEAHEHSESSSAVDASHFAAGDVVTVVEIDPSNASSPLSWTRTILSVSGNDIVFTSALSSPSFDSSKLYRIISTNYSAATATQQTDTYQADDADALVEDTRQPYALAYFGAGQSSVFTRAAATELPARHALAAYGDGVALDTGYELDLARNLNNLLSYKAQPENPETRDPADADVHSGVGTYELVGIVPIDLGMNFDTSQLLYVAPQFKSIDGGTATVRYTLGKLWPLGASRADVSHTAPYVQVSFSTTSTSYTIPATSSMSVAHLNRTGDALGGRGWLAIELTAKASHLGVAHCHLGPRVTPSPPLIEHRRSICNGMHPETAFYAACVRDENRIMRDRHRCVYKKRWAIASSLWGGVSGTAQTIGRGRFRTGYGATRLRVTIAAGYTGSGTNPKTRVKVTKVGGSTTTVELVYGVTASAKTDAPDEWTIYNRMIDVDAASAYTLTVETDDYARPFAVSCMELGPASPTESTNYWNSFVAQADAPLLDTVRERLLLGSGLALRQNGGFHFDWSLSDGAARARTSATAVNLIDNSTSGAPTTATPGFHYETTYRNTASRTTVPMEFSAYASMASGTGTITVEDASTTYATISVNSATPQWWTATGNIPASAGKLDIKFAGDGTNAISVYAVSGQEYES